LIVIRFFVGLFEGGSVLISFVLAQELLGSSVWTLSGMCAQEIFLPTNKIEQMAKIKLSQYYFFISFSG